VSGVLRRFLALTRKDLRLIVRSHYLTVVLGLAVLYALVIHFVVPAELSTKPVIVLWDRTSTQIVRTLLESAAEAGGATGGLIAVDSAEEYADAVRASGNRLGIKVEGTGLPERLVVTYQGHENPQARHLLEATLKHEMALLTGRPQPVIETRTLRAATPGQKPAFNMSLLPILVFSEAVMIGLLLAAALLYSEKSEGTIHAYRVSPGGVVEYLLAKSTAMGLLGVAFTALLTVLTVGVGVNWPVVLGVVFISSVLMTLIVLVVANLFRTINQFLFTGVALNLALALPTVTYFLPSVSPAWFKVVPSYPLIFALREAYFPTGSTVVLGNALGQILLSLVIVLPLAVIAFRRQLTAGGGP